MRATHHAPRYIAALFELCERDAAELARFGQQARTALGTTEITIRIAILPGKDRTVELYAEVKP